MKRINIAIDGPSAAGKSTIAKALAQKLNYVHLDTGAMYRCCALKAQRTGLDIENEQGIVAMMQNTTIQLTPDGAAFLDGENVTSAIRQNEMSMLASTISRHPQVRAELVRRQQEIAKAKGFILDGRDIGSVVLPDAELKVYQTASVEKRAYRRYRENIERGIDCNLQQIESEIRQRDEQDMNRPTSPLRQVEDAYLLDTSDMSIEQSVNVILQLAQQRIDSTH